MMEEIIALKNAVILQHEIIGIGNKRLHDGRTKLGMIKRAKQIANIMQQRTNHIFLVAAILKGAGRGLQAVFKAVNGKAAKIALQHFQMFHHPVGQGFGKFAKSGGNFLIVFLRPINHGVK